MAAAGIIFANIHDNNIPELTRIRTLASVPFACRYRFIDFTLSNMVNSDIYNISIITHNNYRSLLDHIGSGKDWDLARRSGGIKVLPPYITAFNQATSTIAQRRLESLKSVSYAINHITDDYVVLSDCDVICNVDINKLIEYTAETDADMTIAVKNMYISRAQAKNNTIMFSDENGRVIDALAYPEDFEGEADVNLNIIVMKTRYLQQILLDATAHNYNSLTRDVICRNLKTANYRVFKYDGYFATINSFADYYEHSMNIINNPEVRKALFNVPNRPIYTKVRNSTPAYYADTSNVKNSLIADGCVIEGTVENSIIFRGAKIARNATVKNSIIMQDAIISEHAFLNCVIADKNTVIKDSRMLSGAESQPYYVSKGQMI